MKNADLTSNPIWRFQLYYGDNLNILRRYIPDKSVDLIYLDPPFKSNQTYNIVGLPNQGVRGYLALG